jgi:hypothetical protein
VRDALKGSPPIDQRDFLATRILDDLSAFRREGPAASAGGQGRERTHPEKGRERRWLVSNLRRYGVCYSLTERRVRRCKSCES